MKHLIKEQVALDVALVKNYARVVAFLSPDNASFDAFERKGYQLNIIAIIGKPDPKEYNCESEEAILAEIGISKSRPYGRSNTKKAEKTAPRRHKHFKLSKEQYILIAPFIFSFIYLDAKTKIGNWKNGAYKTLGFEALSWKRGTDKPVRYKKYAPMPKGIKYSFSFWDPFFINDVYWAEINNGNFKEGLKGLGRSIDKALNENLQETLPIVEVIPFRESKGVQKVSSMLRNYPVYKRPGIFEALPYGDKNVFYQKLRRIFIPDFKSVEQICIEEAERLGDPQKRTGNIQLRIVELEKSHDYVVVEVHTPWEPRQIDKVISVADQLPDEPPF